MAKRHESGDEGKDQPTEQNGSGETRVGRRSYLQLAGTAAATAGATFGLTGSGAAATTVDGIEFDRVVNIVDDYGADPTGSEPIDAALDDAIADRTLVTFPEGRYQFGSVNKVLTGMDTIGFLGQGNVEWVPPTGAPGEDPIFNVGGRSNSVNEVLLKNVDVDIRADNTTAGFKFLVQDGFHVEDVEFVGRGDSDDYNTGVNVIDCFVVRIANSSGVGTLKNVVAKKGSHWARYGGGRAPLWAGPGCNGTIRVIDCHFEEFGGSGIYATAIPGKLQVEGGVFRNNNGAQLRFGGDGSYVDGALVEIDESKYTGARESQYEDSAFRHRGIRINQKSDYIDKPAGAEIRNCDIVVNDHPAPGFAIDVRGPAKTITVRNTRIQTNADVRAIFRQGQVDFGHHPASTGDRWLHMDGVSITGDAAGNQAVLVREAPDTVVENSCIEQNGSGRDGIRLSDSDGSVVQNDTVDVTGSALETPGSSVSTSDLSYSGSCPVPGSGTDDPTGDLPHLLTIEGGQADYEFTVGGDLEKSDEGGATIDGDDTVDGSTATGQVDGGTDGYRFSGDVLACSLDGSATVYLDGQEVDPAELDQYPRTLTVTGEGTSANYEFGVDGDLVERDGSLEEWDDLSGSTASGWVTDPEHVDGYRFSGNVTDFSFLEGSATVEIDGQAVDPSNLGTDSHTLTVTGQGTATNYEFTVSGDLSGKDDSLEPWDDVSGSTASGWVTTSEHVDVFTFTGEVTDFAFLQGEAAVEIDGQSVDPGSL